jgi:hypothetical protein
MAQMFSNKNIMSDSSHNVSIFFSFWPLICTIYT